MEPPASAILKGGCSQKAMNIYVILNAAQLRYESQRLKKRDSSLYSE
jgi:hypothetical protein